MGNLIPCIGAVIGGGVDLVETKAISNRAYKWFFEEDFSSENNSSEDVIEIEATDLEEHPLD